MSADWPDAFNPNHSRPEAAACSDGAEGPAGVCAVSDHALAGSTWECRWNEPDVGMDVAELPGRHVMGPSGGVRDPGVSLRELAQWSWGDDDQGVLNGSEWCRCRFDAPESSREEPWRLELDGLATVADLWVNGDLVLHSENMWVAHRIEVDPTPKAQRNRPCQPLIMGFFNNGDCNGPTARQDAAQGRPLPTPYPEVTHDRSAAGGGRAAAAPRTWPHTWPRPPAA